VYDDIDSVAVVAEWVQLQLGRARWLHVRCTEPDSRVEWRVHSDDNEQCEWLHKHSDGECDTEHRASWCKCNRWTVDMYDDLDSIVVVAEWVQL